MNSSLPTYMPHARPPPLFLHPNNSRLWKKEEEGQVKKSQKSKEKQKCNMPYDTIIFLRYTKLSICRKLVV